MVDCKTLCFIWILSSVRAQVRIGDLFFPITVQPPLYEIPNNDRTDTLYDEIIDIRTDNELQIPKAQLEKNQLKSKTPLSKPDGHMTSTYLKPSDVSYKTDEITSKDLEITKSLFPPKAIQFKEDSGIPLGSPMPSKMPSFGLDPIITMSHAIVMNNETPEVEAQTLPPLALLSSTNDVIDRGENKIQQENTSVTKNMDMIIPKLENDVQRLDLEVSVLKDLVQKLLRHVYREKRKAMQKKQQTLDSPSSQPFLHTWKDSHNN
ncbi:unnamed protein product [Auanema sp. JU1783]|nr:unnamed protein product [Auanema sp. JU1783]